MATEEKKYKEFEVYKGLQKPLVFKAFRGKYIYWFFGTMVSGVISCIIISLFTSFLFGGLALVGVSFGGMLFVAQKQKQGLYNRDKKEVTYIFNKMFFHE
jgi:hypothetical protein